MLPGVELSTEPGAALENYFYRLLDQFGPQEWWPARTRLEVILGAVLTQNTNWQNAARAVHSLQRAGLLNLARLCEAPQARLESLLRPAGYYRQKARTIRNFLTWLEQTYAGSLKAMFARPAAELRRELLAIKGLGEETVDAILLYAGRRPFFVADAYTRRVLARHGWVAPTASYAQVQRFLHGHLPPNTRIFNEFHALLVEVGKRHCGRSQARCAGCPLEGFLPPTEGTSALRERASRSAVTAAGSAVSASGLAQVPGGP
jgi:endonuclease III related protein